MQSELQWISGLHAVEATLRQGRVVELCIAASRGEQRVQALVTLAEQGGLPVRQVERAQLDKLLPGVRHQGIAAHCKVLRGMGEGGLDELLGRIPQPLLLLLDGVQDPHNLGACLRSADAAGVDAVIVPKNRAAGLTPVVRKVASGAAEVVPLVQVTNLARTMQQLQRDWGLRLVGAAEEAADSLYQADLRGPLGLVMGAEGKGLRRLTREHCDRLVTIPMAGSVASLNVSVATGVCLFEAVRQRLSATLKSQEYTKEAL